MPILTSQGLYLPRDRLIRLKLDLQPLETSIEAADGRRVLVIRSPHEYPDLVNDLEEMLQRIDPGVIDRIDHAILLGDTEVIDVPLSMLETLLKRRTEEDDAIAVEIRKAMPRALTFDVFEQDTDPKHYRRMGVRIPASEAELEPLESFVPRLASMNLDRYADVVYLVADDGYRRLYGPHFYRLLAGPIQPSAADRPADDRGAERQPALSTERGTGPTAGQAQPAPRAGPPGFSDAADPPLTPLSSEGGEGATDAMANEEGYGRAEDARPPPEAPEMRRGGAPSPAFTPGPPAAAPSTAGPAGAPLDRSEGPSRGSPPSEPPSARAPAGARDAEGTVPRRASPYLSEIADALLSGNREGEPEEEPVPEPAREVSLDEGLHRVLGVLFRLGLERADGLDRKGADAAMIHPGTGKRLLVKWLSDGRASDVRTLAASVASGGFDAGLACGAAITPEARLFAVGRPLVVTTVEDLEARQGLDIGRWLS